MQLHVVGNAMDVGESTPNMTTDLAMTTEGALWALLMMPTLWGAQMTRQEARDTFQDFYGVDPLTLTPEEVARRLSRPGNVYFAHRHRIEGIEEIEITRPTSATVRLRLIA